MTLASNFASYIQQITIEAAIDNEEILDDLRTHVEIVKWTDTESDERVKPRPKDIRELHESGLSKEDLERLGYDPSVL